MAAEGPSPPFWYPSSSQHNSPSEKTPFEKETHLPCTFILGFKMLYFWGAICFWKVHQKFWQFSNNFEPSMVLRRHWLRHVSDGCGAKLHESFTLKISGCHKLALTIFEPIWIISQFEGVEKNNLWNNHLDNDVWHVSWPNRIFPNWADCFLVKQTIRSTKNHRKNIQNAATLLR